MLDPNKSIKELENEWYTNEEFYRYLIDRLRVLGFTVHEFTAYQFRVENVLDVYPVNRRWHDIEKNIRGSYRDIFEFVIRFFGNRVLHKKHDKNQKSPASKNT